MAYAIPALLGRRKSPKKKNEYLEEAMSKQIRVECEGAGFGTKIYLDDEDLLKKITGIYGVKFQVFCDGVTELKLYQQGKPFKFTGKAKVLEIFGEENYSLIDRSYIEGLKGKIKELKKENQELHKLIKK
ncbi:MAG: hypothetical protein HWN68_05970 [Desulfobacterales bacterium]|nr:hypothetical protein [Desulfobacterales bacterium]